MEKRIIILGSTGSIGSRAIDVICALGKGMKVVGLAAGENWKKLAEQAKKLMPQKVVIAEKKYYKRLADALSGLPIDVAAGNEQVDAL